VTNVVKKIGELLEPAEVVGNGEIGLEQAMELLQGIHGALVRVVEEETLERRPEHVRHRLAEEHHLHDLRRHRVVEPRHNALVDLKPLRVMPHSLGVDGFINMVDDAKLAERGVEESTPHAEVVLGEVEDDRNVSTNVHMLDGHGGDQSRAGGGISKGVGGVDEAGDRRGWARRHERRAQRKNRIKIALIPCR
jgi:hypothetical protein